MQKLTDLCQPPIVGKKYIVKCIETIGFQYGKSYNLPVIGDFHTVGVSLGVAIEKLLDFPTNISI